MGDELRPGVAFAGVVVDSLVASGGMGSVYRATDSTLRRTVALKVIAPVLAQDSRFRHRFLVEARLAATLEHPAIVPVYAAGEADGRLYLSMRFMDGGSLADLLDASPALSLTETVRLLGPVADALDAAHAAGLVHRDVKPGNILLQGDRAYLADFGLAVTEAPEDGPHDERSGAADLALSGTMAYLAPERIEGDQATGAADQYALGCVAFECLTGVNPFARSNELATVYAHLREPPPTVAALRPELPSAADAVLARALAKDPKDRFGSCKEFVDALESTASSPGAPPRASRRRRWRRGGRVAILAAAGVAAAAAGLAYGGSPGRPAAGSRPTAGGPPAAGDAVAVLDPAGMHETSSISVGADPLAITSDGRRSVWVVNADDHTISRIDAVTASTSGSPFALVGDTPSDVAYGEGALWVSAGSTADALDFGTITDAVVRVDPTTDRQADPVKLRPNTTAVGFHHSGSQIAVGGGSVWVIDGAGSVERIDPRTNQPQVIRDDGYQASAITFGDGAVWVLGERSGPSGAPEGPFVWRIDPRTRHPSERIAVQASGGSDLAAGAGSVWVASPWDGLVIRIHPGAQLVTETINSPGASALQFDQSGGTLWVADPLGHTLRRIDPATHGTASPIGLPGSPQGMAFAGGRVFASVINAGAGGVTVRPPGEGDVQRTGCQGVWSDPRQGRPDLLVIGDFPLDRVASRVDSEAVLSVLAEHGFRAGQHTVGYQVCDDRGNATTSLKPCADFARAYARSPLVAAVITGYFSDCARLQLPALLNAPGGAVAAIGTMNTEIGLTDGRHPNYVRLVANNSDQVDAAINVFAGRQVSRVFVVSESLDIPYCRELMDLFRRMGGRHLTIVGATDYHALDRSGIDRLAQQVRRAGATGVYLIGGPESTSGMLVRALRAVSPGMVIVAPDGMNPISAAISVAGDAARGMYVTSENPPNDLLPPTGRQWLHRFAATQLGGQVPTSSTLAAASAEVLLDAIARSHGGRGSVADALPTTDLPDSVIGPIRFTPRGDIEECAVSVYQIVGGTFFVPDVEADLQGAAFVQRAGCSRAAS